MRIAVLIIGLILMVLVGMQSCAVMVGGEITSDTDTSEGGAVGILVAFLFLLGSALVMGFPRVSMVLFILASLLGFAAGSTTDFSDMIFWGVVGAGLAIMSFFGSRELAKKKKLNRSSLLNR